MQSRPGMFTSRVGLDSTRTRLDSRPSRVESSWRKKPSSRVELVKIGQSITRRLCFNVTSSRVESSRVDLKDLKVRVESSRVDRKNFRVESSWAFDQLVNIPALLQAFCSIYLRTMLINEFHSEFKIIRKR